MRSTYRLAGHTVEIESLYPQVHTLCADYRVGGGPEYRISITPADIAFERDRSAREDLVEGRPVGKYGDGYLETLAVYRKLTLALLPENILLVHGSVVAVDGEGYLFTAKSGTGKSTHTRLWMEVFGPRAVMVNGDKPLLHVGDSGVTVYGTPWDGKEHLSRNMSCPLKAICILARGEDNRIWPVSKKAALPMLLQQCNRPREPAALAKALALTDRLGSLVPIYRLECNMSPEAAVVAYEGMDPKRKESTL